MLPHSWRKFLAIVRLVLAISCLALQLIAFNFALTDTVAIFVVYILYSLAVVLRRGGLEDTDFSMFALAIDFLMFLLAAVAPVPYGHWITAVFYGYLQISAVLLHNWWKAVGVSVASVIGIYCAVPLHGTIVLPILIAGGIVAIALATERDHLEERLSHTSRQTV
jgi:hypothetical protein